MTDAPGSPAWLDAELARLVAFGRDQLVHPGGGAAWLDAHGRADLSRPVFTWITTRMVHVHALAHLEGFAGSAELAERLLAGLTGPLRDRQHDGWHHAVLPDGTPDRAAGKSAYAHAFVMLAGATATRAQIPGGKELLDDATAIWLEHIWDDDAGRTRDSWDHTWQHCDPYRGLNSAMHGVEAMLAVAAATGDPAWLTRARRMSELVVDLAAEHEGRLPEHFDEGWIPDLDLNRDRPDDAFKPYGATVGHAFEWSRLLLELDAALGRRPEDERLVSTARLLFDTAARDGWAVDGADGFVYTTDFAGRPVVRTRMHWVAAEAVAAAATMRRPEQGAWWAWIEDHLVDRDAGSWHHELDVTNRPAASVWPGKPDLYHAVQAVLLARSAAVVQ